MRCPKCNHHVPDNTKFCPNCGEVLPSVESNIDEVSPESFDVPVKWTKKDTYAFVGFGICFITGGVLSPVGLVFSILSLKGKQKNRWVSYWGLAANLLFILIWITLLIVFFVLK